MKYTHPACTPFHAVVLLAVVVPKRQFSPCLQTSFEIFLCYLLGHSVVLVLDHRFQYYFIGCCDKKGQKLSPGFQMNCGRRGEAHVNLWYVCHYQNSLEFVK